MNRPLSLVVIIIIISACSKGPEQNHVKEVDALVAAMIKPGSAGVSVAVAKEGKILFSKGYGFANVEYDIANTPSTIFHVASVSKQFTAFAITLLHDQGKLS